MMKTTSLFLALAAATPALLAGTVHRLDEPRQPASGPTTAPAPASAHAVGTLRIVTPDGGTVLAQAAWSTGTALQTMTIDAKKAFAFGNGRCAFNVKYDERSDVAMFGTVNQIHDNDVLVAQNSGIDLAPGVTRTLWTQPYLQPGVNNLRLTVNATGIAPAKAWVRVQVNGDCKPATSPVPPSPPSAPASAPHEPPHTTTGSGNGGTGTGGTTTPPTTYGPGSPQWQALYNAWGYSNYGTTQLKGKGYARYDALVALNADLTAAVQAGKVTADQWNALMKRWATFTGDPDFVALMKSIKPTGDGNSGGTSSGGSSSGGTGTGGTTAPATFGPGSPQWQAMFVAWGYSNYGTTQLKGKGYARYDQLAALNADLTAAVKAGKVTADQWNALMTRWASFTNDPDFVAAMKAIVPTGDGH